MSMNIPTKSEAVSKTAEQWHEDGRAIENFGDVVD